uniref:Uncharacterized protein n=1 Tax=Anolis carolinensis TaxID=28377 RepID=A0A803TAR1_ANOCA
METLSEERKVSMEKLQGMDTLSEEGNISAQKEEAHILELKSMEKNAPSIVLWAKTEDTKPTQLVHAGSTGDSQTATSPQRVKYEPEEGLQERWEAQWQEFLKTLQTSQTGRSHAQFTKESSPWDNTKSFLAAFEQVALACRWPQDKWTTLLQPALSGEAEEAFHGLSPQDRRDFQKVKGAILHGQALARERQRQHFRKFCYQEREGPRGVYSQLRELCQQWLRTERYSKEEILELLILEQFLTVLPQEMQSWVRARGPETCVQAVLLAEGFLLKQKGDMVQEEQVPALQQLMKEEAGGAVDSSEDGQSLPPDSWKKKLWRVEEDENGSSLGREKVLGNKEGTFQKHSPEQLELRDPVHGRSKITQYYGERISYRSQQGLAGDHVVHLDKEMDKSLPKVGKTFDRAETRTHEEIHFPGKNSSGSADFGAGERSRRGRKVYKCSECGKVFRDKGALKKHERVHTGEKPYKCSVCEKSFANSSNLTAHERIHKGEKPYKCSDCGRRFSRRGILMRHEKIHSGRKPFKCVWCPKSFTDTSNLAVHERIHKGERPFQCSECGKSFNQKGNLMIHERIHTGERPFTCRECGRSFSQKGNLVKHEKMHTGEKGYTCAKQPSNMIL